MNFAISVVAYLLVPDVHQEAIENLSRNMHQKTACLSKFAWPLNQSGIKGFSKNKK